MSIARSRTAFARRDWSSSQYENKSRSPTAPRPLNASQSRVQYIGIGTRSNELTDNLSYLWKSPKTTKFPVARTKRVGEIGWNISTGLVRNNEAKKWGVKRREFLQYTEDRQLHTPFQF